MQQYGISGLIWITDDFSNPVVVADTEDTISFLHRNDVRGTILQTQKCEEDY